jgi:hypothetical protein
MTPIAYDGKGFPDLVGVRERIIFVECKGLYRPLEPAQEGWRDRLTVAGAEWYRWDQRDLEDGTVTRVLAKRLAPRT